METHEGPNLFLMDDSQGLKGLQGTTGSETVCSSNMLVRNYEATRCHNSENNKNLQGCGNFRSVTSKENSGLSSVPLVCCLLTLKRRNQVDFTIS
jgi:hypothetical protein